MVSDSTTSPNSQLQRHGQRALSKKGEQQSPARCGTRCAAGRQQPSLDAEERREATRRWNSSLCFPRSCPTGVWLALGPGGKGHQGSGAVWNCQQSAAMRVLSRTAAFRRVRIRTRQPRGEQEREHCLRRAVTCLAVQRRGRTHAHNRFGPFDKSRPRVPRHDRLHQLAPTDNNVAIICE